MSRAHGLLKQIELQRGVRARHEARRSHFGPRALAVLPKVVGPLTDPIAYGGRAEDAFDLVLPSLPGYGFSGKPQGTGWNPDRIARAWTELMRRLGYALCVAGRLAERYRAARNELTTLLQGNSPSSEDCSALPDEYLAWALIGLGIGLSLQAYLEPTALPADLYPTITGLLLHAPHKPETSFGLSASNE